jgi:hypothetical protein
VYFNNTLILVDVILADLNLVDLVGIEPTTSPASRGALAYLGLKASINSRIERCDFQRFICASRRRA